MLARFQLAGVEPVIEADQKARALRDRVRRSLGSDGRILRKKRERGQRQQNTPQAPEAGHSGPQSRDLTCFDLDVLEQERAACGRQGPV